MNFKDDFLLDSDRWELFAVVGPGSMNNAKYSFTLKDWSVDDHSLFMVFSRQFPFEFTDSDLYSAVGDLEHILISLFINDHVPRTIEYFWYPNSLDKDIKLRLLFTLGQKQIPLPTDTDALKNLSSQGGWIFNHKTDWYLDVVPPFDAIEEWFHLFVENESISGSVGLLQGAFATINRMAGQYRHYDYLELASAFILMVSGLESLFLYQSQDHADISFKFKVIGAAYYRTYVTEAFLKKFSPETSKLSSKEVMDLLGHLYRLRSAIAHGRTRSLFSGKKAKEWKTIFQILHVEWKEPEDRSTFFSHLLLALGLLQKHIFALIWCSKRNLFKGVRIIEEVFADQETMRKKCQNSWPGKIGR